MAASGELLFTILSSLAQEESRNISENTQWGIRSRFKQGIPHLNTTTFMGYDKDAEGHLVVNEEQAKVVRRIFKEFLEGWNLTEISHHLNEDRIPGVTGKARWSVVTIQRMLQNEKYKGDLLMQKWYTVDYLNNKLVENDGTLDQYYVQGAHEAIVSAEEWEAAQEELKRRETVAQNRSMKFVGTVTSTAFYGRVFCGNCGEHFIRKDWKGNKAAFWKCFNADKKENKTCDMPIVRESDLRMAFTAAWNSIVEHPETERWDKMEKSKSALERLRARQMKELIAEGPLEFEIPELTRMVLQEITVKDAKTFQITFLDGTIKRMKL